MKLILAYDIKMKHSLKVENWMANWWDIKQKLISLGTTLGF